MSEGSSAPPRLTVTDLAAQRGGRLIFRGLSFTAGPGEAVVVLGPNGSGKSTLLRLLAGLSQPEAGTLARTPADQDGMRFAGHRDGLKSGLTVMENLSFWASVYGAPAQDIDATLERFGLNTVSDMPVDVLSAGWRRRSGLARLGLGSAPLWILDEPYTALDSENVARVDDIISTHINGGGMAVIATHQSPGFAANQTLEMSQFEAPAPVVDW